MKIIILSLYSLLVALSLDAGTEKAGTTWKLVASGTKGRGNVQASNASKFKLTLTNTVSGKNYATVVSRCNMNVPAQQKLMFRCRGSQSNADTYVIPMLSFISSGKKRQTFRGPKIKINNSEFKNHVLGLDSDFHLSDATWNLRQIKFAISNTSNIKGKISKVEIVDIKLADVDDMMSTSSSTNFIVVPAKKTASIKSSFPTKPIKIYFDFDNEDLNAKIIDRKKRQKDIIDNLQTLGYQAMLLEAVIDLTIIVNSPQNADLIVYSRAAKSKNASAIATAVKAGKSLLVFGTVPDPEVAKLLPVTIAQIKFDGLAQRQAIEIKQPKHPIFDGIKLNPTTFGIYRQISLRHGKALTVFSGGMPATVEGKAGKGKVIYCSTGIGTGLINSDVYHDAFTLRAIWYLAGVGKTRFEQLIKREHKLAAKRNTIRKHLVNSVLNKAKIKAGSDLYQVGMSLDNFGRFGWLIGEGLLCDNVGRKLNVGNGTQEYRFCMRDSSSSIPLTKWNLRPVSGAVKNNGKLRMQRQDYSFVWSGQGVMEYTISVKLPAKWRGSKIYFSVDNGIDDLDEVKFNGVKIGSTGKNTPHYWQAPRHYKIPEKLVRFGKNNTVKVLIKNLRGSAKFNSCPRISANTGKSASETLSISKVDWTHKSYNITDANGKSRRMVLSLLLPFILYQFDDSETILALENIATHVTWQDVKGLHTADLQGDNKNIFSMKRDGKWTAPWLLLWQKHNSSPLLLAFEHQVKSIKVINLAPMVNKLIINSGKTRLGRIVVGRPWGVDSVNTSSWKNGPDATAMAQIKKTVAMALRFPVGCDEIFTIKQDKVKIVSRFRYESINDDWKTAKPAYAFLPPLAGFALQRKMLVTAENVLDFGMPTKFGPLIGRANSSTVSYTLPLPPSEEMILPDIEAESEMRKNINAFFAGGVRWSAGGRTAYEDWTPARPRGSMLIRNIDMFGWNLGLGSSLQGMLFLNNKNRNKLLNRVRARFAEPIEYYQYKAFVRFREEPFSGMRYPILFNSFYPNKTPYASGFGSKVIYGDENEACSLVAWIGRQLADRCAQASLVKANWNFFRQSMRYMLYCDDWAFNSSSCREFGVGAWIDMLNGEYAAMVSYARLAELAGDLKERNHALYRAAKRMLPTLLRLHFSEYLRQHKLIPINKKISTVSGFNEQDGARCISAIPFGFNFHYAMDMFDFSQGFPSELILLYKKYTDKKIGDYLHNTVFPLFKNPNKLGKMGMPYLPAMAFWNMSKRELRHCAKVISQTQGKRLMRDWPGIRANIDLGSVIYSLHPGIYISRCRELDLCKALYNPKQKTFILEYRSSNKGEIRVKTILKTIKIVHNNNALKHVDYPLGEIILPVSHGLNQVIIYFDNKKEQKQGR